MEAAGIQNDEERGNEVRMKGRITGKREEKRIENGREEEEREEKERGTKGKKKENKENFSIY